jgi:hypothetical protein
MLTQPKNMTCQRLTPDPPVPTLNSLAFFCSIPTRRNSLFHPARSVIELLLRHAVALATCAHRTGRVICRTATQRDPTTPCSLFRAVGCLAIAPRRRSLNPHSVDEVKYRIGTLYRGICPTSIDPPSPAIPLLQLEDSAGTIPPSFTSPELLRTFLYIDYNDQKKAHTTIARGQLRVPSAPLYINHEAPD